MKDIGIGGIIARKRKEIGITQDDLANFIGVSKASVSKWETGHSYPDIIFLPRLAAYFNLSMDELMGYNPQMADTDIHRLCQELLTEFAAKPFDEVKQRCLSITKEYFSCFPLLLQIGLLLLSYGSVVKDDEKKNTTIREAKELFYRVKTMSDHIDLKQLALRCEAICELALENPQQVIDLLKNKKIKYSLQPSIGAMLSQAYQSLGETQAAKLTLQESMLESIITFFYDASQYLPICTDNRAHFEEVCQRTISVGMIFEVDALFPIVILSFYIIAAEGYITLKDPKKAIEMLEAYQKTAVGDIFPLTLRASNYFTLVDELLERQQQELPFALSVMSRDEGSIRQDIINAVVDNPALAMLKDEPRYKIIVQKLQFKLSSQQGKKEDSHVSAFCKK